MKLTKDNSRKYVALLMVCAMMIGLFPMGVFAGANDGLMTSSGNTVYNKNGSSVPIDPALSVGDIGVETISEASVIIRDVRVGDTLHYSTLHGIAGSYNAVSGVFKLSGAASREQYQDALRSVAFSTTDTTRQERTIDFMLGSSLYFSGTGNFYEFVSTSSSISWTDAKSAAESRVFFGRQGYLVTITSAEENLFVQDKAPGNGWIGARDINRLENSGNFISGGRANGDWRWVTGPEGLQDDGKGLKFYSGYVSSVHSSVQGVYSNWNSGEPNDYSPGEWVVHIFGGNVSHKGKWNDYPNNSSANANGYLVEYGDMPDDTPISIQASKNIEIVNMFYPSLSISAEPASAIYPQNVVLKATLTGADNASGKTIKFYDGATKIGEGTTNESGIATCTVDNPAVAEYSYNAVFDGDADNTSSVSVSIKVIISPKPVTINGIVANGKEYDGTVSTTFDFSSATIDGVINSDDVSIDDSHATATFSSADAGLNKNVTFAGFTLSGTMSANYTLSGQPAGITANITPATITVTPDSGQSKYYGQSDPAITYSTTAAAADETAAFSGYLSRAAGDQIANDYAISLGSLVLNDNGVFLASNYELSLAAAPVFFEIKAYTPSAVATATPNGENGWFKYSPVTLSAPEGFSISISDTLSGNTWPNLIILDPADGANKTATYYLRASSGTDTDAISTQKTFNYNVDTTSPATPRVTATSDGDSHTSGNWGKNDVELTVSGSTADSGIAKYQYSSNSGETWVDMTTTEAANATDTTPFNATKAVLTLNENQIATYQFRAISNSGLSSNEQNFVVKIDKTTPDILVAATNSGAWISDNVAFTLGTNAAQISGTTYQVKIDDGSYVDVTSLAGAWDATSDTLTISTDTSATYQFKAISGAGLSNESDAYAVKIDKTNPEISTPTGMPDSWVTEQQTITFAVTENGSGIKSVTVKNGDKHITPTKGETVNGMASYTFTTTGNGIYTIDAVDNASNQAAGQTTTISLIDTDLPVITTEDISYDVINTGTLAQIGHFLTFGNFFKEGIKITIPATDATSGLDKLYYSINDFEGSVLEAANASYNTGNANVTISFDRVKDYQDMTVEVYATDAAGNKTVVETLKGNNDSDNWTFENTNPVIGNFNVSGNDIIDNQWFNDSSVTVNSTITDVAGIYKVSYKIDGAAEYTDLTEGLGMAGASAVSYDFSKIITGEGAHNVELLVRACSTNQKYLQTGRLRRIMV